MPLRVHGHDSRAEIEAAYCYAEACGYGVLTDHAPWIHREGVLWQEPSQCDLLFVTLRKSEALVYPTTSYHDLARKSLGSTDSTDAGDGPSWGTQRVAIRWRIRGTLAVACCC